MCIFFSLNTDKVSMLLPCRATDLVQAPLILCALLPPRCHEDPLILWHANTIALRSIVILLCQSLSIRIRKILRNILACITSMTTNNEMVIPDTLWLLFGGFSIVLFGCRCLCFCHSVFPEISVSYCYFLLYFNIIASVLENFSRFCQHSLSLWSWCFFAATAYQSITTFPIFFWFWLASSLQCLEARWISRLLLSCKVQIRFVSFRLCIYHFFSLIRLSYFILVFHWLFSAHVAFMNLFENFLLKFLAWILFAPALMFFSLLVTQKVAPTAAGKEL